MPLRVMIFVWMILVPVTTALAQQPEIDKPLLVTQVEQQLPAAISRLMVIQGLNYDGKEVVAKLLVSAAEFDKRLRAEPNVIPDMFWTMGRFVGPHKHAWKSRRTTGSHRSLQYTIYRALAGDYVEMDIDRDCPQWDAPIATARHLALAIVPQFVAHKILRTKAKALKINPDAVTKSE